MNKQEQTMEETIIKNGDVFDIGQTVNGVSKFLWFNDKWYYLEGGLNREYEYDQKDLTKTVLNKDGMDKITFIDNKLYTALTVQQASQERDSEIYNKTLEVMDSFGLIETNQLLSIFQGDEVKKINWGEGIRQEEREKIIKAYKTTTGIEDDLFIKAINQEEV